MMKYNIDQSELTTEETVNVITGQASAHKVLHWYERFIVALICPNFRVKSYHNGKRQQGGKLKSAVMFYGLDADVQLAKEVYVLMVDAIEYYAKAYIDNFYAENEVTRNKTYTVNLKTSYMQGFLSSLKKRLDTHRSDLEQEYGLVLVTPNVVEESFQSLLVERGAKTTTQKLPSVKEREAFNAGVKDGKKVDYTRSRLDGEELVV